MFEWLSGIKPRWFATLYLATIPARGVIYSYHSEEFYQPNIAGEVEAAELRERVQGGLLELAEQFFAYAKREGPGYGIAGLDVTGLRCQGFGLTFVTPFRRVISRSYSNLAFRPQWATDLPALEDSPDLPVRIPLRISGLPTSMLYAFSRHVDFQPGTERAWGPVRAARFDPQVPVDELLALHTAGIVGILAVSPVLYSAMEDFRAVCDGSPGVVRGGFGRFVYLSAVTITTLGYGDIVPMTDKARGLVGSEAVFGVALAGLFINSIWSRRTEKRPQNN